LAESRLKEVALLNILIYSGLFFSLFFKPLQLLQLNLVLEVLELLPLLDLLLHQALEFPLLQVADQDLPLLILRHASELAELVVLEKTKSF